MNVFQKCLITLDVERARSVWNTVFPHVPPPKGDREMLATLHLARTQSETVEDRLRKYSDRWLTERNLPSHYDKPRVVSSVGISVNSNSSLFKPIVPLVRTAMEDAVKEVYADGEEEDIGLLRRRMSEARGGVIKKLLGI